MGSGKWSGQRARTASMDSVSGRDSELGPVLASRELPRIVACSDVGCGGRLGPPSDSDLACYLATASFPPMPSESDLACLASSSPVFPVPRTLNWAVLREDESDPSSLRAMAFPDHPLIGSRQSSQMIKPLAKRGGETNKTRLEESRREGECWP